MYKQKNIIPVFFATDDGYAPFAAVAIKSLSDNASVDYEYKIYILTTDLSDTNRSKLKELETSDFEIKFVDVNEKMNTRGKDFHLRDYYSFATYYRFFIPEMFPQYKKGIYLDCDIAVLSDISELYNKDLGNNLLAAVNDEIIADNKVFGEYAKKVIGVETHEYFNAGILVMNLEELRKFDIESALINFMKIQRFPVAQDQDYLNVLCKNRVLYLDKLWNKTAYPDSDKKIKPHIAHYKINFKPWHYDSVGYEEYFWKYANKIPSYIEEIENIKRTYTEEQKSRDSAAYTALEELAIRETKAVHNSNCILPLNFCFLKEVI